ncbi:MAG: alginate lyase family protein [Caldilinea sp.]|nr:alginate lyase family protein [Caldilineaceae bacterium]MCW5840834.1 alginate lyase family protein [Caldilinea sp.]
MGNKLRYRLLGAKITDGAFLQALSDNFPTAEQFARHIASDGKSPLLVNITFRDEFLEMLRQVSPAAKLVVVSTADEICDHVFDLLGSGPVQLGESIDWHLDFKSGYRFDPSEYYADLYPAGYPGGYDIKTPWELSRFQHLVWLGQAFWFTHNDKYPAEFVKQVVDWIEKNPYPWGVNWTSTMDVAIRSVNWLWGYHLFRNSSCLDDRFVLILYKSLLEHGRHIRRNLENQGGITNNHYLANLVGLIYLGLLCPEFMEAAEWREFGLTEIEAEMQKQVYADGVSYEASTSYHRLALEMFLSVAALAQRTGHVFERPFMQRLEKMLDFVMSISRPDGTVPLIGDNDNGRLHRLKVWENPEREWNDFRYLLAIGAVIFDRDDFACAAQNQWEEALWLLPVEKVSSMMERSSPKVEMTSHAFENSGFYVLRTEEAHVVVERGEVGLGGKGSHNHYNPLGYELWMNGYAIVVDPGTFIYTGDWHARERYRSRQSHNTFCFGQPHDPANIEMTGLFGFRHSYTVRELVWRNTHDFDQLVLESESKTGAPSTAHRRTIVFWKDPAVVVVQDSVLGQCDSRCTTSLHFAADLAVQQSHIVEWPALSVSSSDEAVCSVAILSPGWSISLEDDRVSPGYGVCLPSYTARLHTVTAIDGHSLGTVFFPPACNLAQLTDTVAAIRILLSESLS